MGRARAAQQTQANKHGSRTKKFMNKRPLDSPGDSGDNETPRGDEARPSRPLTIVVEIVACRIGRKEFRTEALKTRSIM
jgi:hypothetical protein